MGLDLITKAEYKAYAGITSTNQDSTIDSIIPKVSSLVKTLCRRTFVDYVDDSKIETFKGGLGFLLLTETPILMVSSVEFSDDYGSSYSLLTEYTDYVIDAEDNKVQFIAEPYISLKKTNAFKVTYTAGYEEFPEDLKLAILDLVGYYVRNDAAIHAHKPIGANTVQIEYITNTQLPAHIRRVLDQYTAYYG